MPNTFSFGHTPVHQLPRPDKIPSFSSALWANLLFILPAIPVTICAIKISPLGGFDFYGYMSIPTFPDNGPLLLTEACILFVAAALLARKVYMLIDDITKLEFIMMLDGHMPHSSQRTLTSLYSKGDGRRRQ